MMTSGKTDPSDKKQPEHVKLWDPLLRGFHWLLAFCVIATWLLGEFGPSVMTLHFWLGYVVIALLLFRLIWGFVGPAPARFTHFVKGPGPVLAYLRHMFERRPSYWPGHNPMGALAVLALLGLLIMQTASGLFSDPEDFINTGPLASKVSSATSKTATGLHNDGATLILLMVLIHVGIILFYRFWKHENLIRPMITGWKWIIRR